MTTHKHNHRPASHVASQRPPKTGSCPCCADAATSPVSAWWLRRTEQLTPKQPLLKPSKPLRSKP